MPINVCRNFHIHRLPLIFCLLSLIGLTFLSLSVNAERVRGNEFVISYNDEITTLDPAIGYDWQNFSLINSIFDGLLAPSLKGGAPVPNLAESFSISDDGTRYTFKLRQNIKFHNGRTLVADDVLYSFQRMLHPEMKSPGAAFYKSITGFEKYRAGTSSELTGVSAIDEHTISIQTDYSDSTLLWALALNFSRIVPREEVEKGNFDRYPVGTGPFKVRKWVRGRLELERNQNYHQTGIPYLDSIVILTGQNPQLATLKFERNEIDMLGDKLPINRLDFVLQDSRYENLVSILDIAHTSYITMNVNIYPFDKVEVRRAVNMAIDKAKIVALFNGMAIEAKQILPPQFEEHDEAYNGYSYAPETAKKLLEQAGIDSRITTELLHLNFSPYPEIARLIQSDLAKIGIAAQLRPLSTSKILKVAGDPTRGPMVFSGGLGWIADFPDASNFYLPLLSSDSAIAGGWNWAFMHSENIDNLARLAIQMVSSEQKEQRSWLWKKVFSLVMDEAPWVPLYHRKGVTLLQSDIYAENLMFFNGTPYFQFDRFYRKSLHLND